jgi:hypothetical protein
MPQCLTVLTVAEQKAFGKEWNTDSRLSGLTTVQSVAIQVVKTVFELDEVGVLREPEDILRGDHWQHYRGDENLVLGAPFPVHALISVESIDTANEIADYLNKLFEQYRGRYPKKHGWNAIAAHSRAPVPLDRNHPFFRYKESGHLDARCSRFLVVKNMAVEGMNNKYLSVWGAAESCASIREVVQRLGRPLRSAAVRQGSNIIIPPASHDRVYVITHEMLESAPDARGVTRSTAAVIAEGVRFILDMRHATAEIMTLDEYVETEVNDQELRDDSGAANLSRWIKFQILTQLGQSLRQGRRPQIARIVRHFGGASELRRHSVRAYAQSALDHHVVSLDHVRNGAKVQTQVDAIHDLKTKLLRIDPPARADVLEAERMSRESFNMESARNWLKKWNWTDKMIHLMQQPGGEELLSTVTGMHNAIEGIHDQTVIDLRQTPAARIKFMALEIASGLKLDDDGARRAEELVREGALHYLPFEGAAPSDLEEGGQYCRPEITFALRKESFVMQLQAWVCFMLLSEHRLNDLWAVLRFEAFWDADTIFHPQRN